MWNPDDWLSIPTELQARPQWMVCKGIEDKSPLTLSGYRGDPTDPRNWSSFADAYSYAAENRMWIGYCLSSEDPYTIVDMDNKQQNPEFFEQIRGTYEILNTYIERSMSGLGMHAIVRGDIGAGRKRAPFELYSRERFMVMTGDVVKSQPISSAYTDWLNNAAEWCGPGVQIDPILIDWTSPPTEEELYYDDQCLQWFATFTNVSKIERWFYGDDCLDPNYTRRSEDDAALLQLYYKFNAWRPEQRDRATIRMFLRSPRATHYLMRKQDWQQYVARTLGKVKAWVNAEELRVSQMQAATQNTFASHMGLNGNSAPIGTFDARQSSNPYLNAFFTASELKLRPDIAWAVHNLLPIGGLAAIYGESGAGKSFVAIDMIAAIARGVNWFKRKVAQLPVACLALEGSGGLKKRVIAWEKQHRQDFPDSVTFYDGPFSLRAENEQPKFNRPMMPGNTQNITQFCTALNERAGKRFEGVVFVDTLNQASEGADENSSRDMNQLINGMKLIQQQTGSLVVAVHHATKSKENQSMRGHGSFKAACDAVIEVYTETDEHDKVIGRAWRAEKVKDWESGDKGSFELKPQLGTNSVAIHELWEPEEVHDEATGDTYVQEKPREVRKGKRKEKANNEVPWQNGGDRPPRSERESVLSGGGRGRPKWGGASQLAIINEYNKLVKGLGKREVEYWRLEQAVMALPAKSAPEYERKNLKKALDKLVVEGCFQKGEIGNVECLWR